MLNKAKQFGRSLLVLAKRLIVVLPLIMLVMMSFLLFVTVDCFKQGVMARYIKARKVIMDKLMKFAEAK